MHQGVASHAGCDLSGNRGFITYEGRATIEAASFPVSLAPRGKHADRLKQQSLEARVPLAYDQLVGISAARYAKALAIGKNDFNAACSWAAGQNWRSTPNVFASLHKAAVGPMTPDEFVAGTAPSAIAEDLLAAVGQRHSSTASLASLRFL